MPIGKGYVCSAFARSAYTLSLNIQIYGKYFMNFGIHDKRGMLTDTRQP